MRFLRIFGTALVCLVPAVASATDVFVEMNPPCRIADTRSGFGGVLASATPRDFTVTGGVCAIPSNARAVSLNVTVIAPTQGGFLSLYPSNAGFPGISTINFDAGTTALANGTLVALRFNGVNAVEPSLRVIYGVAAGSATAHLALDATGYF